MCVCVCTFIIAALSILDLTLDPRQTIQSLMIRCVCVGAG